MKDEHSARSCISGVEETCQYWRNLPGRRETGIDVLQTVAQQSADWFEIFILLEKFDPELTSKMLVVTSFLLAMKKSVGKRSELLRYRAVEMMWFPVQDGG